MDISRIQYDLLDIAKLVWHKGWVAWNDGNLSYRLDNDRILITPTGESKGFLKKEDLVIIDFEGNIIEGNKKPTSERLMHIEIYNNRPDIKAIVHTHPPYSTAFSTLGKDLDIPLLPEMVLVAGKIPCAPYATPSTEEVALSIRKYTREYNAILLQNHGLVTFDVDLQKAYYRTESAEHFAKILFIASCLGDYKVISEDKLKELNKIKRKLWENEK